MADIRRPPTRASQPARPGPQLGLVAGTPLPLSSATPAPPPFAARECANPRAAYWAPLYGLVAVASLLVTTLAVPIGKAECSVQVARPYRVQVDPAQPLLQTTLAPVVASPFIPATFPAGPRVAPLILGGAQPSLLQTTLAPLAQAPFIPAECSLPTRAPYRVQVDQPQPIRATVAPPFIPAECALPAFRIYRVPGDAAPALLQSTLAPAPTPFVPADFPTTPTRPRPWTAYRTDIPTSPLALVPPFATTPILPGRLDQPQFRPVARQQDPLRAWPVLYGPAGIPPGRQHVGQPVYLSRLRGGAWELGPASDLSLGIPPSPSILVRLGLVSVTPSDAVPDTMSQAGAAFVSMASSDDIPIDRSSSS